jgi:LysM repeat protein
MNEKIEKIAHNYNLTVDEIKVLNQHISNWDNIIAGSKLILPNIPERIKDELNDIEPFIEDYYPKISDMKFNKIEEEEIKDNNEDVLPSQENKTSSTNNNKKPASYKYYNSYYSPYFQYYPYYPMYNTRRIRKK